MNEIQTRDPETNVGEVLPHRSAEPTPAPHVDNGLKRYLAPLLLVSIAMVINVLAYLAPDPAAPTPEATMVEAEMSAESKIKAAEQLKAHGDQFYEEGYSWMNDYDALQSAHASYTKAWELITGHKYPMGDTESSLIVDSVQCSILQEHLRIRLNTLEETFRRNDKIKEYLP
jgi:hypothetical protein